MSTENDGPAIICIMSQPVKLNEFKSHTLFFLQGHHLGV